MPWQGLRGEAGHRVWSEILKLHGVVATFMVASDAIAVHCHNLEPTSGSLMNSGECRLKPVFGDAVATRRAAARRLVRVFS